MSCELVENYELHLECFSLTRKEFERHEEDVHARRPLLDFAFFDGCFSERFGIPNSRLNKAPNGPAVSTPNTERIR